MLSVRLALFFCFLPLLSLAQSVVVPPPLPGWTHSEKLSLDTSEHHGIILDGKSVVYSAAVIAEVDGNTANGKEVVVMGRDSQIHVYHADGSKAWSYQISDPSCSSLPSPISAPAVGELLGDGLPYVVVGYGGVTTNRCDGGIVVLRGTDGSLYWKFSTKEFDHRQHVWAMAYGVVSTPALADVDNDGKLEIGFGSFDRSVYLLNPDKTVRWYYQAADTVWSSPAFADINNDGKLEMIIGTDISQNLKIRPPTHNGGFVYALKTDRRNGLRINFRDPTAVIWKRPLDQVVQSGPVVANVLPGRASPQVIVESGCFFPQNNSNKTGKWVKVLNGKNGKVLQTLYAPVCSSSSVAIGDIDDDGILEIVATILSDPGTGTVPETAPATLCWFSGPGAVPVPGSGFP